MTQQASPVQGEGAFAIAPFKKGDVVAVFGGYVVSLDALDLLEKQDPGTCSIIVEIGYQIADHLIFSPIHPSQFSAAEFLNHSCEANCGFASEITLVALRDIASGEEVSIDYATCVSHEMFEMECNCGRQKCRGRLLATDWMRPDLQSRYAGFFQPYLARKIGKRNE